MFICLSSGATPKYKRDIIRALGQPNGSRLQFRYSQKYVDGGVLEQISKAEQAHGEKCLIAFFDDKDNSPEPEIIPCRYASVEKAELLGTTVIISMILDNLAYCDDLAAFNRGTRNVLGNILAKRDNGNLTGKFCCVSNNALDNVIESTELKNWDLIVSQLASKSAFSVGTCFYNFEGIYETGKQASMVMKDVAYSLAPNRDYEVHLYYKYISDDNSTDRFLEKIQLQVLLSNKRIQFTTNPTLDIDSRYDQKIMRFRTSKPTAERLVVLSLYRKESSDEHPVFDFDLLIKVRGRVLYNVFLTLLIGVALAAPPLIELFKHTSPVVTACIYIVSYLVAGGFAVFHIDTPLSAD